MKNREPIWWLPLLRRILGWGLVMAMLWFLVALLISALPLLTLYFPDTILGDDDNSGGFPDFGKGFLIRDLQILVVWLLGGFSLCGFIAGSVAAFCALASETSDPLRSRFFRSVGTNSVVCWILLTFAALIAIGVSDAFFDILYFVYDWWMATLGFCFVLFALSLWRAINRALAAAEEATRA